MDKKTNGAKILNQRSENNIDKNMLMANIKLMDENELLKKDNQILQSRNQNAIKNLTKLKDIIKTEKVMQEVICSIEILQGLR